MKIQVDSLGLPTLSKLIGRKVQLEMPEGTVEDLVARIVARYGLKARKILLDSTGKLDHSIQVFLNDKGLLPRQEYSSRVLQNGDSVKLMMLVGGG